MNVLIPMEDVSTFVSIRLVATIVHVLLVTILLIMDTLAHVRSITSQ